MPFLNWRETGNRPEISPHPKRQNQFLLKLSREQVDSLARGLSEVFATGGELRIDLPGDCVVFWKMRDSESRLLLAHPRQDEWVATAALTSEHLQKIGLELKALVPGGKMSVGDWGPTADMSNTELIIQLD